jgi:hypothetical protein
MAFLGQAVSQYSNSDVVGRAKLLLSQGIFSCSQLGSSLALPFETEPGRHFTTTVERLSESFTPGKFHDSESRATVLKPLPAFRYSRHHMHLFDAGLVPASTS